MQFLTSPRNTFGFSGWSTASGSANKKLAQIKQQQRPNSPRKTQQKPDRGKQHLRREETNLIGAAKSSKHRISTTTMVASSFSMGLGNKTSDGTQLTSTDNDSHSTDTYSTPSTFNGGVEAGGKDSIRSNGHLNATQHHNQRIEVEDFVSEGMESAALSIETSESSGKSAFTFVALESSTANFRTWTSNFVHQTHATIQLQKESEKVETKADSSSSITDSVAPEGELVSDSLATTPLTGNNASLSEFTDDSTTTTAQANRDATNIDNNNNATTQGSDDNDVFGLRQVTIHVELDNNPTAGKPFTTSTTYSSHPPEFVFHDHTPPSINQVGNLPAGTVSGEIVAVSVGCILVFWVILGPIAYAIYRSREKAKKARRIKDKSASAAVLEEIIRVELAKGRSRLYRTAVGDERELERLSLDDYGVANWQHHIELPSSHSLFRSAYLDSPMRTEYLGPIESIRKSIEEFKDNTKVDQVVIDRDSSDNSTRISEMCRRQDESCSDNSAFVMATEPRSRRYSTVTRLPTMGSSASLQRRALYNLSSPTSDRVSDFRMSTSASVNHLASLRQGALEPHIIGSKKHPQTPEGNPPHHGIPDRHLVSPTGVLPEKPRFPIMGQASLVHGSSTHRLIVSDRRCSSDVLQRRVTPRNCFTGQTPGGCVIGRTQEEVWRCQASNRSALANQLSDDVDYNHDLEDSVV